MGVNKGRITGLARSPVGRPAVMTRTRIGPILVLTSLLFQAGCSGKSAPPPTEEEVNLKKLAILIGQYRAANRGALPTSPAQVKAFAGQMPADRLQGWNIDPGDLDNLLRSEEHTSELQSR